MSVSAAETGALICAFRLSPSGALGPEALDLVPTVEAPLWLHFNLLDNRARRFLEQLPSLDDDARAILLGTETRIQRLLQEEIASRLGEATNRNLYLLSIATTTLLPITLITGVFGRNVGGLPLLESRHGFWWVMLGMTFTVVVTTLLLRKIR